MNASRISAASTTLPTAAAPSQNSKSEGTSPLSSLIDKVGGAKILFAAGLVASPVLRQIAMFGAVKNLITR